MKKQVRCFNWIRSSQTQAQRPRYWDSRRATFRSEHPCPVGKGVKETDNNQSVSEKSVTIRKAFLLKCRTVVAVRDTKPNSATLRRNWRDLVELTSCEIDPRRAGLLVTKSRPAVASQGCASCWIWGQLLGDPMSGSPVPEEAFLFLHFSILLH